MKLLTIIFLLFTSVYSKDFDIKTYEANFTQTVTNPSGKIIKYQGKIYIKQPNNMKWNYTTPVKKTILMKEKRIIIVEPELEQVIYTQMTDEINLLELLNYPEKIDKKYKLTFDNVLFFGNNKLTDIEYQDDMDNNIKISFTNIKLNETLRDFRFYFNVPSHYDIIRK